MKIMQDESFDLRYKEQVKSEKYLLIGFNLWNNVFFKLCNLVCIVFIFEEVVEVCVDI